MVKHLFVLFYIIFLFAGAGASASEGETESRKVRFYVIELQQQIDNSASAKVLKGLEEARSSADYVILRVNTYGGALDAADSIRSAILRCPIPVVAFIDIQAASAGALISIACDSIYMSRGGSIGAATVVNRQGEVMPDKYQSFMRAMMRSTAESHGKRVVQRNGERMEVWHRDPHLAESMVGRDSVLSLTPLEAIENGFCEGEAQSIDEVISKVTGAGGEKNIEIIYQKISFLDSLIYLLMNPFLQGLFLMMIIGGIYFEMQSPGIGFALFVAIVGALLYFAPLYLEGLAQNWEILLFLAGVALLVVEIFVLPGFGIAGISGVVSIIISLTFAMIDNSLFTIEGELDLRPLVRPLAIVLLSLTFSIFGSILLASRIYRTKAFSYVALKKSLESEEGYVGVESKGLQSLVGMVATVATDLKPSGKVEINGRLYPAHIKYGYARSGEKVMIISAEGGQLYCNAI